MIEFFTKLEESCLEYFEKAKDLWILKDWVCPMISITEVDFAGFAEIAENRIHFNWLIYIENAEEYLAETVPHEIAHLVDYRLNGGYESNAYQCIESDRHSGCIFDENHSEAWQEIFKQLTLDREPNQFFAYKLGLFERYREDFIKNPLTLMRNGLVYNQT